MSDIQGINCHIFDLFFSSIHAIEFDIPRIVLHSFGLDNETSFFFWKNYITDRAQKLTIIKWCSDHKKILSFVSEFPQISERLVISMSRFGVLILIHVCISRSLLFYETKCLVVRQ